MCINIDEIDQTEIILIVIYITYLLLWLRPLRIVRLIPLESNSKRIRKTGAFQIEVNDRFYVNDTLKEYLSS